MTKLYYDCAIQAAYMAKEFGVRLCNKHGETINLVLVHMDDNERINIHPDSLHIFKPQVGDLIELDGWAHYAVSLEAYAGMGKLYGKRAHFIELECIADFTSPEETDWWFEEGKILSRNNKSFIWPLSEGEA